MINAADLEREAVDSTRLDDFGHEFFRQPLRAWVDDLNRQRLNDFGKQFLRALAVTDLKRRLKLVRFLSDHPEIDDVELPPIVFVAGFVRSGSTLLHNLLHVHPRGRALLRWELMNPLPPPEAATWSTDARIAKVQRAIEPLRGSMLERMHWVNADEPEECPWGFYDCTGLLGRGAGLLMRGWGDFITESNLHSTYVEYRRLIKLLLWRNPVTRDGFLVLKSPTSNQHLSTFSATFPEARFVMLHRDPYRVLVSACVLSQAIATPFSVDSLPFADDGGRDQAVLHSLRVAASAMTSFANSHAAAHVTYQALMSDPAKATKEALNLLGIDSPQQHHTRIVRYLEKQRTGRVAPPEAYDSFGYDHDAVWNDDTIREYVERFGLEPERRRLTHPAEPTRKVR